MTFPSPRRRLMRVVADNGDDPQEGDVWYLVSTDNICRYEGDNTWRVLIPHPDPEEKYTVSTHVNGPDGLHYYYMDVKFSMLTMFRSNDRDVIGDEDSGENDKWLSALSNFLRRQHERNQL